MKLVKAIFSLVLFTFPSAHAQSTESLRDPVNYQCVLKVLYTVDQSEKTIPVVLKQTDSPARDVRSYVLISDTLAMTVNFYQIETKRYLGMTVNHGSPNHYEARGFSGFSAKYEWPEEFVLSLADPKTEIWPSLECHF